MENKISIKVSVIIPVYNAQKYLKRLWDSLIGQSLKDIEFILVNDGSTDNSRDILEAYSRIDERVHVINKENEGVSVARNAGLLIARGEYVGFVDSDDFVASNMYEKLYNKAMETKADIVSCGHYLYWPEKKVRMYCLCERTVGREQAIRFLIDNEIIGMSSCSKLFSRKILNEVKFPEEYKAYEDRYFIFQAMRNADCVTVIPNALYYYCVNQDSTSQSAFNTNRIQGLELLERMNEIIKKDYPQIEPNSYADVARMRFHTLVSMYTDDAYKKYSKEYSKLLQSLKGTSLLALKKHVTKSVLLQIFTIKYYERGFRTVKKNYMKIRGKR